MKFSVRFNNDLPADRFMHMAALAEEAGFDQIWVSNDLFWHSAPVLVAEAARVTSRITLGVGVFNPVSMHPVEIAMVASSLHEVSSGRFCLGLGAGADQFLEWAGLTAGSPVSRTERAIKELRALFGGHAPEGWRPEGRLRTSPVFIPIYVGAMGPRMLQLAGRHADGALPLLLPPKRYGFAAGQVADGARQANRDPESLDVAACIWCSIDGDEARAKRALASKIAYYGASFSPDLLAGVSLGLDDFKLIQQAMSNGDVEQATDLVNPAMLSLGVAGAVDEVLEACANLVAAGARHISFGPPLGPDPEQAVIALGAKVIPALAPKR
ncbi:MAG TPA: LLM class flavin-dependent oxidoreductase [Candidatus Baltobacterales bacterium]|nr:LLM class flavin-dependent oxidoreductase [Candidatus Baltobacterales bacterium]